MAMTLRVHSLQPDTQRTPRALVLRLYAACLKMAIATTAAMVVTLSYTTSNADAYDWDSIVLGR